MTHKNILFQYEMIWGKTTTIALGERLYRWISGRRMPGAVSFLRLNDDGVLRSPSNPAANLVELKLFRRGDDEDFLRRHQLLGAVQGVFQYRPLADEVQVLLRQMVGTFAVNQIPQPSAVST